MKIMPAAIGYDPYGFAETHLSPAARDLLARLAETLRTEIAPLMNDAWESATMPPGVLDTLIPLDLMNPTGLSEREASSSMFAGFRTFVLARTDVSVVTVYNAQAGLFRAAIALGGSPEQAARWEADVRSFALKGVFALTEPDHGSDIAEISCPRPIGTSVPKNPSARWGSDPQIAAYATRIRTSSGPSG